MVSTEMVSRLQALGFAEYEARCYLGLVNGPPCTAYDISKVTGVPRANVYSVLEKLIKKGAVQPVSEQPARFAAMPPTELLASISRTTRTRCDELAKIINTAGGEKEQDIVWTLIGEDRVSLKISDMLARAKRHIWIKASDEILSTQIDGLRAAHKRGVEVIVVLFGDDPKRYSFGRGSKVYLHEGNGVRIGVADNLFTLTIDFEEALTASMADGYVGAYTRSGVFVTMAETIIRHDIYMAEIFAKFGDEIASAFGPHLKSLRGKLFSADQLEPFKSNLRKLGLS